MVFLRVGTYYAGYALVYSRAGFFDSLILLGEDTDVMFNEMRIGGPVLARVKD